MNGKMDDQGCNTIILLLGDQILLFDVLGRQVDQASILAEEQSLLDPDNSTVLDTKLVYRLLCADFKQVLLPASAGK